MRLHIATIVLVALAATCLQPASARADSPPHGPAEQEGRTGLVFGFDGERLTAFDGAMLALRRQLGERTGLRLGLSLGLDDGSTESSNLRESELIFPDSTAIQGQDVTEVIDDQTVDLEVDLLLIRHARSRHPVRFFYGGGPMVGYEHEETTRESLDVVDGWSSERTFDSSETTWRWGLRLAAGIEWFITEAISVHAEYRFGLVYTDHESTSTMREVREYESDDPDSRIVTERRERESEGWDFDSHHARFGVSLFF